MTTPQGNLTQGKMTGLLLSQGVICEPSLKVRFPVTTTDVNVQQRYITVNVLKADSDQLWFSITFTSNLQDIECCFNLTCISGQ